MVTGSYGIRQTWALFWALPLIIYEATAYLLISYVHIYKMGMMAATGL